LGNNEGDGVSPLDYVIRRLKGREEKVGSGGQGEKRREERFATTTIGPIAKESGRRDQVRSRALGERGGKQREKTPQYAERGKRNGNGHVRKGR